MVRGEEVGRVDIHRGKERREGSGMTKAERNDAIIRRSDRSWQEKTCDQANAVTTDTIDGIQYNTERVLYKRRCHKRCNQRHTQRATSYRAAAATARGRTFSLSISGFFVPLLVSPIAFTRSLA